MMTTAHTDEHLLSDMSKHVCVDVDERPTLGDLDS
jgi:hypothetical protein